jgi:hypothetical protein
MFMLVPVLFAQNLILTDLDGNTVPPNGVMVLTGDPAEFETVAYVNVTNSNDYEVDLRVKKVENFLLQGTECQICLGLCYPPFVYETPQPFPLGAGQTTADEEFSGHYLPGGYAGLGSVSYIFFDFNNPSDSVMFTVQYDIKDVEPSLKLSWEEGDLDDNAMVEFSGTPDVTAIQSFIYVTNNSNHPLNIHVRRIVTYVLPETVNYFCWGACFPPDVDHSLSPITIEGGATNNTDFIGDYEPHNQEGMAYISYVFYDEANPGDYATVNVQYNAHVTDINDNFIGNQPKLMAYPNPADKFVTFEYENVKGSDAKLVVYNLLGSVVKEIELRNNSGTLKNINTSDLKDGIYFYSLVINNESKDTQKLIIKH